jgi:dTDP-4-amino-4,6-dideoxygalactose transaminase
MSNVAAAIGRGQLKMLAERVSQRRGIHEFYRQYLGDVPGITLMPEPSYAHGNRWLTCMTVDPDVVGCTAEQIRTALEEQNIEARPLWKPMHLQPVFRGCPVYRSGVSELLFRRGLCLPSGTGMTEEDKRRIVDTVLKRLAQA